MALCRLVAQAVGGALQESGASPQVASQNSQPFQSRGAAGREPFLFESLRSLVSSSVKRG